MIKKPKFSLTKSTCILLTCVSVGSAGLLLARYSDQHETARLVNCTEFCTDVNIGASLLTVFGYGVALSALIGAIVVMFKIFKRIK